MHPKHAFFYFYLPIENVRCPTFLNLNNFDHQTMANLSYSATEVERFLNYARNLFFFVEKMFIFLKQNMNFFSNSVKVAKLL